MEAVFVLASTLVIRALFAWPWKSFLSLGLFLLILLDPAIAELFSHLYSDQVWLLETLLGLACFAIAFSSKDKIHSGWLVFSALSWGSPPSPAAFLFPFCWALLALPSSSSFFFLPSTGKKISGVILDFFALSIWTLLLGLCIIYDGTCRYDSLRHGYCGISYLDSDQYKKFYLCLQSVGDPTGDPYFPIDENRRKSHCPGRTRFDVVYPGARRNDFYKQAGLRYYGKSDIPAGWFHWAAFTATMHDGDYLKSFAIFQNIEEEVAGSSQHGLVKVRPIIQLPDSRIPIVLKVFPDGLHHAIDQLIHEPSPDFSTWKMGNPRYLDPDFTNALTRRIVHESPLRESVWHSRFLRMPVFTLPSSFIFISSPWRFFWELWLLNRNGFGNFR